MNKLVKNGWYEPTPLNWSVQRMKNILFPKEGRSSTEDEELLSVTINDGVIKRSQYLNDEDNLSRAESLVGYKIVEKTDLVNNIMKMSFRCLGVSSFDGIVSPAYSVFSINKEKIFPNYLNYLLRIDRYVFEYRKLSKGIQESRMRLYDDYFLAMKVLVPPLKEQKRLCIYLDKKVKILKEMITKHQEKVSLLEIEKSSYIYKIVTKGLNHNVKMQDSGIEWIGKIPTHWKLRKLKHFFDYKKGGKGQTLTSTYINENAGKFPVYSGQTENDGILGFWKDYEFDFKNDVIFCTTVGAKCMSTKTLKGKFSLSQNCLIMLPKNNEINSKYINYFLQYDFQIRKHLLPSILQPSLRMEDLDQYWIILPNIEEQNDIVKLLNTKIDIKQKEIEKNIKKIKLYSELLNSLITSVVTGKLKVKGY